MEQRKKAKNKTLCIFSNTILLLNKWAVFDYVMFKLRQCGSNAPDYWPEHACDGVRSISAFHQGHMQTQ